MVTKKTKKKKQLFLKGKISQHLQASLDLPILLPYSNPNAKTIGM